MCVTFFDTLTTVNPEKKSRGLGRSGSEWRSLELADAIGERQGGYWFENVRGQGKRSNGN